jgi:5S rRNA maturation endonuclease (ribonuclease M5)
MADGARAQKLMNELFGQLPTAETVVALIEEANYEKLLKLFQDVQDSHGAPVANLLMKQVKTIHPAAYAKYQAEVKKSKTIILDAHNRAVDNLNAMAHGLSAVDYQILLAEKLEQSHLSYIVKVFFEKASYIDLQAFLNYMDEVEAVPSGFPDSWPDALVLAYTYEPMEAYVQQVYHNAPEALQTEDNLVIIATRLAQGLTQAAWKFGRETRRKASGT